MTTMIRLTYYGMEGEGRTVKEAKADAGRKLEALVKQKDTEPRVVTIGNSAAIYWHDQSGWRVALAVVNGKPQTRLCAGYPGEASEDEAMSKAASWAAETEWNQECNDDQAFFCDAVSRFVGKRDLQRVVGELVNHTSWHVEGDTWILILHDENDNPIASASYTLDNWVIVFKNLVRTALSRTPTGVGN